VFPAAESVKSRDKTDPVSDVSDVSLAGEGKGHVPNDFDAVAEELAERGKDGPVYAEVRVGTITPPAIAAGPDDDVLDLDPAWRQ
jgi:hypothetical protein